MKIQKRTLMILAAFALLGSAKALAQADMLPVSRTAGVLTVELPRSKSTLVALTNAKIVASGTVDAVNGSVLTLSSSPAVLPDVLTQPHAIKIVSRANTTGNNAYGLSATITAQTSQNVTAALSVAPNIGDQYVIFTLTTISSLFGATNTIGLTSGNTAATADIVYLTLGGNLTGIFYNSAASKWRLVSDPEGADQNATVVPPDSGLLVARRDAGSAQIFLPLRGDALPGRHVVNVTTGFTIANNPFMVPTTLGSSGLQQFMSGGSGPGTADVVYLESNGVLKGYFFKTSGLGGTGWRTLGDSSTNQSAVVINPGKAMLFKEQAGDVRFALPEPLAN